jgi:hypothetical protein
MGSRFDEAITFVLETIQMEHDSTPDQLGFLGFLCDEPTKLIVSGYDVTVSDQTTDMETFTVSFFIDGGRVDILYEDNGESISEVSGENLDLLGILEKYCDFNEAISDLKLQDWVKIARDAKVIDANQAMWFVNNGHFNHDYILETDDD